MKSSAKMHSSARCSSALSSSYVQCKKRTDKEAHRLKNKAAKGRFRLGRRTGHGASEGTILGKADYSMPVL